MIDRDDIRLIVGETMNILEKDYAIEELENLGAPTCDEITERIARDHGNVLGSGS